jgi:hypothetical protein
MRKAIEARGRVRGAPASRTIAAGLAAALSGCSFTTMQRPPSIVEDPRVSDPCTTSVQAPVSDTILAAAALVGAYVATFVAVVDSVDSCSDQTGSCSSHFDAAPALALVGAGALFGSSAAYGFVSSHQCKRRTSLTGQCANGNLAACRRVVPGWTPPANLFAPRSVPPQGAAPPAWPPSSTPPSPQPPPPPGDGQGWIDVPVGPTPPPPEGL